MNKMTIIGMWLIALLGCGCNQDLVEYHNNDLKISVEKGEEWLHDFPLFMGINKKNPPQLAIWTEDMEGRWIFCCRQASKRRLLPLPCYRHSTQNHPETKNECCFRL